MRYRPRVSAHEIERRVFLGGVAALGGACLDWFSAEDTAGVKHFENQVWIERIPEDERDMIQHLVFINSKDGRFGAVGNLHRLWRTREHFAPD